MKLFKRRYRSKNQQVVLSGFTFGAVLLGIVMMVVLSKETPERHYPHHSMSKYVYLSDVVDSLR